MNTKTIISLAGGIGMTIGSVVPALWHGSMLGGWSILLGFVGGIVGIWLGVKFANAIR